ncbi:MAG: hypothetical protein RLZZ21_1849 [Planctomycetota bacterium]
MRAWDGLRGINDHSEADRHLAYFPVGAVLQLANGLEAFIDAGVAHGNLRADLGRRLCFALTVDELRIEIDAAVPLDGVVGNTHLAEVLIIRDFPKNPEVQMRFHVENGFFAVVERNRQREILTCHDFDDGWVHVHGS